jgi:hypothetical protein
MDASPVDGCCSPARGGDRWLCSGPLRRWPPGLPAGRCLLHAGLPCVPGFPPDAPVGVDHSALLGLPDSPCFKYGIAFHCVVRHAEGCRKLGALPAGAKAGHVRCGWAATRLHPTRSWGEQDNAGSCVGGCAAAWFSWLSFCSAGLCLVPIFSRPTSLLGAHWAALLGGEGRGALEETGAAGSAELAARLAGPGSDAAGPSGRTEAAAALNAPVTEEEVEAQLRRLRAGAAAGLDGLGADLLKGAWRWEEVAEGKRRRA